jgi:hypothetical protein
MRGILSSSAFFFSVLILTPGRVAAETATLPKPPTGQVLIDVKDLPPAPSLPDSPPTELAKSTYATRCLHCHGPEGRGDGPVARTLNPRPADFSSSKWQRSVTDEGIIKVIRGGGSTVNKSPLMPPHPDIDGPRLTELVGLLRSLEKAPISSVVLSLEHFGNNAKERKVIAKKRIRLKGKAIRARFKDVPPGQTRVIGFVDLNGDGEHNRVAERGFETDLAEVKAGKVTKQGVALNRASPKEKAPAQN